MRRREYSNQFRLVSVTWQNLLRVQNEGSEVGRSVG
jgi:hypothetical protein